jgi:hypothetical protein
LLVQDGLVQEGLVQKGLVQEGLVQGGLVQEGLAQKGLVPEGPMEQEGSWKGWCMKGWCRKYWCRKGWCRKGWCRHALGERGADLVGLYAQHLRRRGQSLGACDARGLALRGGIAVEVDVGEDLEQGALLLSASLSGMHFRTAAPRPANSALPSICSLCRTGSGS